MVSPKPLAPSRPQCPASPFGSQAGGRSAGSRAESRDERGSTVDNRDRGKPPSQQLVYFVRHGESRWNRAQAELGLVSMMWENDHGLSDDGRCQAEELRRRLKSTFVMGKCKELPRCAAEELWIGPLLKPDIVYSSPFTRAVCTAVIGLRDVLPGGNQQGGKRLLVLMREAREQKNIGGADSTGRAVGSEIPLLVEEEIRDLYEASCSPERAKAAVESFRGVELDTAGVEDEWWGPLTGDAVGDLAERIEAFVERLRWTRGVAAGGGGGATIVVGHSLFFRTVFSTYMSDGPDSHQLIGIASSLTTKILPFCGVVGTRFEWDDEGRARIVEALPLLGTQLPTPEPADGSRLREAASPLHKALPPAKRRPVDPPASDSDSDGALSPTEQECTVS